MLRVRIAVLLAAITLGALAWFAFARTPVYDAALRQPLFNAIQAGDTARVKNLLAKGANPGAREPGPPPTTWLDRVIAAVSRRPPSSVVSDATPLLRAAQPGHTEIVRLLLDQGVEVDAACTGKGGMTPLMAAAGGGHVAVVELLLNQRADINARDEIGRTPLMYARGSPMIRLLVFRGADVNAQTRQGQTVLLDVVAFGSKEDVQFLVDHGANVHASLTWGHTILMTAKQRGDPDILRSLQRAGAKR